MPTFAAPDGTELAYRRFGDGPPLVCLPGGMQASVYLGDLGGLSSHRELVLLDLRGTGESAVPADEDSYRCDRLVDDVEALREHLGLDRMDLLAHSGAANLAALYLSRYPERVGRLALITPSVLAVGLEISGEDRLAVARPRAAEPQFVSAVAALENIVAGRATDERWQAITPLTYGRWDERAQAHQAAEDGQRNHDALRVFAADGAFDPAATRKALGEFPAPVLLLTGEVDLAAPPAVLAQYAALFPDGRFVVQPGAGHFPWLDDADQFVATTAAFLR